MGSLIAQSMAISSRCIVWPGAWGSSLFSLSPCLPLVLVFKDFLVDCCANGHRFQAHHLAWISRHTPLLPQHLAHVTFSLLNSLQYIAPITDPLVWKFYFLCPAGKVKCKSGFIVALNFESCANLTEISMSRCMDVLFFSNKLRKIKLDVSYNNNLYIFPVKLLGNLMQIEKHAHKNEGWNIFVLSTLY